MKDRGQFNSTFEAECTYCNHCFTFDAEPYPGINIVRLCGYCSEVNILTFSDGIQKHRKRNKIQNGVLVIMEGITQVYQSIKMQMGVRQVCYQLSSMGIIQKKEEDFNKVNGILRVMRWRGWLDFSAIVDETRFWIGERSYPNSQEYLDHISKAYRKSLWYDKNAEVQIFIEKLGLASIVREVTDVYDVRILPFRGFNSLSAINQIASHINTGGKKLFMYHFGDYDPSGVCAANKFPETLEAMGANPDYFHFERIAIHEWQIQNWNLPTRDTKTTDTRAKGFNGESCELDALSPKQLQTLVQDCILRHIDIREVERIKKIEQAEKETLKALKIM